MIRTQWTPRLLCALAGTLVVASQASAQVTTNWTAPALADFFDALNWDNGVPTLLDTAIINGDAFAVEPDNFDPVTIDADVLSIGLDGGVGSFLYEGGFGSGNRVRIGSAFNLGYTASGAGASEGFAIFEDGAGAGVFNAGGTAVGRVGVTDAAGDATGVLEGDFRTLDLNSGRAFTTFQIGVSNGAGTATGTVDVSRAEGFASILDVGVANDTGDAVGLLDTLRVQGVDAVSGVANIGVSNGLGGATGTVAPLSGSSGGGTSFSGFNTVNIGIANGTGPATGLLESPAAVNNVATVNLGLNPGGGVASGTLIWPEAVNAVGTLSMGDGGVTQFNVSGNSRGGEYAAVDVTDAALDGTLRITFLDDVNAGRFEFINSASATGLTGAFDTIEFQNLNQGFTPTVSTIVDAGVEKVVLDLVGNFGRPAFANPASGDWFDAANWSTPFAPGSGEVVFIDNGGEATADALTAPGPMEALSVLVGNQQRPLGGAIRSTGVDLTAVRAMLFGGIQPGLDSPDPAIGVGNFTGADLTVQTDGGGFGNTGLVGVSYNLGNGETRGTLNMTGGSIRTKNGIWFGYAQPINAGQSATAVANVDIVGDGVGVSILDGADSTLEVGEIRLDELDQSGTTDVTLSLSDATIAGNIDFGEISNFDPNTDADATVDATLTNVTILGTIDMADTEADDPSTAATDITLSLTNVSAISPTSGFFDWFDVEADDAGSTATSVGNVQFNGLTISTGGDFEFGFVDAEGDDVNTTTSASADLVLSGTRANISCGDFEFVDVDTEDLGVGVANVVASFTDSTIDARTFEYGRADAEDLGVSQLVAQATFTDSTITISESAFVGAFEGTRLSDAPGNFLAVALNLNGSTMTSPALDVGFTNEPGNSMSAGLILNPSLVTTDLLRLGVDGTITFNINGPDRVTAGTVGGSAVYAAVDATDALLEGSINAELNYTPQPGLTTFDVIATGSDTALDDTSADFSLGAPPAGVFLLTASAGTANGVDVVRYAFVNGCSVADLDGSGGLNAADVNAFVGLVSASDPAVDLDRNLAVDFLDVARYLQRVNAGCP